MDKIMAKIVEVDNRVIQLKVEMDKEVESIKQLDTTLVELNEIFKVRIEELKQQFEDKKMSIQKKKESHEQYLRELFEQVPQNETKTQRKVKLLTGDVVVKKAKLDFDKDTDKLLSWAKDSGRSDLINKKEVLSFKWADFKRELVATDDGIVNVETGEILDIDGLRTIKKSEEMEIKY